MTVNYEIGKPRQDKRMRISIILSIGHSRKRIHTDLLATKDDLTRNGKLLKNSPIYIKVREKIRKIEEDYDSLDTHLTGEKLDAHEAVGRIKRSQVPTFFQYAEKWLDRCELKGKKNYKSVIKHFKTFLGSDIHFSAFSYKLLNDYCYTLKDTKKACSSYPNCIKVIYDAAEKEYNLPPWSSFRFDIPKAKRPTPRALNKDILQRIFSYEGKEIRAILARDCCLLSFCLCVTNSADLYNAPYIKNNILAYDRTKTKERRYDNAHIEIDIPKQIKPLVKKYKGRLRAFKFYTMYHSESAFNKAINKGLKFIQSRIEKDLDMKFEQPLTFYDIRHSYATIARNELGIEKSTIHEILNHREKELAIDDIYIKKDFRLINKANKKVVDYVIPPTFTATVK